MVCLTEFSKAQLEGYNVPNCPICLTKIRPMKIANDGYMHFNWEEVRLLAIYAQRWAQRFDTSNKYNVEYLTALQNIINKVNQYQPKGAPTLDPTEEKPKEQGENGIPSPYFLNI